jgi:hypothetical protein
VSAHLPYVSQFESSELVSDFLEGRLTPQEDPRWRNSGWTRAEDYSFWAWHTCGVACLRMILSPAVAKACNLTQDLVKAGGYQISGNNVAGLFYHAFVSYIRDHWGLHGTVYKELSLERVRDILHMPQTVMMLSVDPTIRNTSPTARRPPGPTAGGHLILATDASKEGVTFHDPSGHSHGQSNVMLPWDRFDSFFAQRGIAITIPAAGLAAHE